MKLLVVSDSHDRWDLLLRAVEYGNSEGCAALLHAGDFIAPPGVQAALAHFRGAVHVVLGNCDGEQIGLARALAALPNAVLHYDAGVSVMEKEIGGWRIHMNHYPHVAHLAAAKGEHHLVVYGHTHAYHEARLENGTLLLNPGEVCGHRTGEATCAVVDTARGSVIRVTL